MPCLDISTNLNLNGVETEPIFSEITKTIVDIVGRPPSLVMVVMKGSAKIRFAESDGAAAFGELVHADRITSEEKKQLIVGIGAILESKLGVPRSRFVLKLFHVKPSPRSTSKL